MKVLVVGGGGREHAMAWKVAQSPGVARVFVAPGNGGTAREPKMQNVPLGAEDVTDLRDFAREHQIDLTLVGPEAPLVKGIVDLFKNSGLACYGPSRKGALLEGSKAFAKDFMARHRIPTAAYRTFEDLQEAEAYIRHHPLPLVVKADGLAAGKGVIICNSHEEALLQVKGMLSGKSFGEAGRRVVVEEFLQGEEASFIAMVDGRNILPLAGSQDHKARDDGDKGPNTGGMGAYSPAPVITPRLHKWIMERIMAPTVEGMASEGAPYVGFLYAGLMVLEDGTARVLEFNCRLGDPEAQPILIRLRSDLTDLVLAALEGNLGRMEARWTPEAALGVVMAAGGYPGTYRKGDPIEGLPEKESAGIKVFHAGTRLEGDRLLTHGGRVLCVTALGETVARARDRAYEWVGRIHWPDVYYRRDIGHRAISREQAG